jgi:hypothetical protein
LTSATDDQPSFIEWLNEHHHGETVEELDAALKEVVTAVQTYGKAGRLTFTLDVGTKGRTITVVAETKVKTPKEPATADIFFADEDGALHRKDPFQPVLPTNVVPIGDGETKTVPASSDAVKEGVIRVEGLAPAPR